MNNDKFKIDLAGSSGLGNIVDMLHQHVFLKENAKRQLYKFKEVDGNINGTSLKYKGEAIRPACYQYLFRYDLFYFYWGGKMNAMDKNGQFSTYNSIHNNTLKFFTKSEDDTIIVYPESQRKLSIIIHQDTPEMMGEAAQMLELSLSKNVVKAFIINNIILCLIDELNNFKVFNLSKNRLEKISSVPLYPNANPLEVTNPPLQSSIPRLHSIEYHLSGNYILAQNKKNSIFDLFTLGDDFKPVYITSLQTQLSPYVMANIDLDFFGYPIITMFEKTQNGKYQIISYLFFENAFIVLSDQRMLNFDFIYKIRSFGDMIYVIGGNNTPNGGKIVSLGLNI